MDFLKADETQLLESYGTPDTNRTCDLPLRRGLLYPLSYRGADAILAAGASSLSRCALP
jgi:hypothetical protein